MAKFDLIIEIEDADRIDDVMEFRLDKLRKTIQSRIPGVKCIGIRLHEENTGEWVRDY